MKYCWLLLLALFAARLPAWGGTIQRGTSEADTTDQKIGLNYQISTSLLASTARNTPFWLRTNQFGRVPSESPALIVGGKLSRDFIGKKWDWGFGVAPIVQIAEQSRVILPEAFVKAKFWKIELWGGRRRQIVGLVGDSTLTSGSYVESGNALPIPRVQIGFSDYVSVFNGLFSFKGFFAHGWFDDNPVVKNHFLHQKTFYARLGKSTWPIRLYGGFNHNVQWGGKIVTPNKYTVRDHLPSDWIDYWYVISGKRIPTFGFVDPDKYDAIDRGNRIGNHLGSLDLGLDISTRSGKIMLYRQNVYDDGSLFQLANIVDGLNGISWTGNASAHDGFYTNRVTLEYLNTVSQGGSEFTLDGGPRGQDNYFNHAQYWGWVYGGRTIGTPFITPSVSTREALQSPDNVLNYSNNTRVRMLHLGLAGGYKSLTYLLKLSYSENLGVYSRPFPKNTNQFSSFLELACPLRLGSAKGLRGSFRIGSDWGQLYDNSTGVYISLIKSGFVSGK
ncbi:capsule assembly Wzi family protein [Persicitalea sp.]|uniref:capsule assembly Wzi family protein n=1 Tax=Persicitalea sp. TaxID=3100273 RepID=UPI0035934B70